MKYSILCLCFLARALFADAIAEQLDALQQLRTLIPERVWFQEFSIFVDSDAFEVQANVLIDNQKRASIVEPSYGFGQSKDYFLLSTMSGENVRLLDLYQQFEQSPFWKVPDMMDDLNSMEGK